jgi:hypothetical protein
MPKPSVNKFNQLRLRSGGNGGRRLAAATGVYSRKIQHSLAPCSRFAAKLLSFSVNHGAVALLAFKNEARPLD